LYIIINCTEAAQAIDDKYANEVSKHSGGAGMKRVIAVTLLLAVTANLKAAAPAKGSAAFSLQALRDPFVLPPKGDVVSTKTLRLEGIVQMGDKRCAVLARGKSRDVLEQGAVFEGYTLLTIDADSVVLSRGNSQKRLTLE
jgi:hypothetical protein